MQSCAHAIQVQLTLYAHSTTCAFLVLGCNDLYFKVVHKVLLLAVCTYLSSASVEEVHAVTWVSRVTLPKPLLEKVAHDRLVISRTLAHPSLHYRGPVKISVTHKDDACT
jgi:hypothetical protein